MPNDKNNNDRIDVELVRKLAEILADADLSEIEVEVGGMKVKLARGMQLSDVQAVPAYQALAAPPAQLAAPAAQAAPAPAAPAPAAHQGEVVKSPMVGTAYLQAQPGSPPFVKPGDTVAAGQTVLIIEAMKTMNPVPAPRAGKVLEMLVDDGQPVEFGEPLLVLE